MTREHARHIRQQIEAAAKLQDDETALTSIWMYPAWATNTAYTVDDRIRYGDTLYRCVQGHTSQDGWTPDVTPALWVVVSLDEYPEWKQPTGTADAYNIGDKVTYNGRHYVSLIDGNVWSPDAYPAGWKLVDAN